MAKFTGHTITSDSALGAAKIQRSLRFYEPNPSDQNSTDATHLTRTPSSTGSQKIWTFSSWIKKSLAIGTGNASAAYIYSGNDGSSGYVSLYFQNDQLYTYFDPGNNYGSISDRKFRDPTSWFHLVHQVDATNTVQKIWINGVEETLNSSRNPGNNNYPINESGITFYIGKASWKGQGFNGYLAEVHLIDGSLVAPTDFAFTDPVTGIWKPKRYEGTHGTNGFYLDFSDNTSTATLGIDKSLNGNDFSANNFSIAAGKENDSLEDTPSNNFCTMNELMMNASEVAGTHSNGNLTWKSDNNYATTQATFPVTTGRWYWECEMESQYVNIAGITRGTHAAENTYIGYDTNSHLFGFGYYYNDGTVKGTTDGLGTTSNNNLATSQTTAANGDILGIASDITNGYLIFYKNGTHIYTITGISNAFDWFPSFSAYGTSATWHVNFGQRPFSYTPPAGHKSLCSKNLSPNTPSVLRPQKHFDTVLYTGNGSTTQNISGLEFTPDFVWIKSRSSGSGHHSLMDSVRSGILGYDAALNSNQQIAEYSVDAFTINDNNSIDVPYYNNDYSMNTNSATYVAWCWKAGGAAVTNTVGNISAQVSANDEAGFSIITYTGDGNSSGNVGTGLRSTQPLDWAIVKRRDSTSDWQVGHSASGQGVNFAYHLNLNDASVLSGNSPYHMATQSATNGDRLYLAEGGLTSSATYVAYVWQERPGYSKFGSYTGNGNSNGTYVHLGFRPACIIIKNITTNTSWVIYDIKRSPTNVVDEVLFPNGTSVSGTTGDNEVDFLAKGFKYRAAANKVNSGSKDYVYMAFAEQPNPTPFDSFANAR